uniref:Uncharacterized protein n=1 Tax=Lactuca sativa TaxID=4236 RepID=A0A9R1W0G1_LACSA|nr:hypothetical protein LSAT_V11C300143820 [Lactuca sativa]
MQRYILDNKFHLTTFLEDDTKSNGYSSKELSWLPNMVVGLDYSSGTTAVASAAAISKGSSEMHREQYEDSNAETKVKIENLKKLVETQREQYEDIQQKYEDVQQKYEDAQKKNVEFQQKNVDVQAKFE